MESLQKIKKSLHENIDSVSDEKELMVEMKFEIHTKNNSIDPSASRAGPDASPAKTIGFS